MTYRLALLLIVVASLTSVEAAPTNALPAQLTAQLRQLRDAALSDDYALRQVSYLSNNIGPRLSGSPQAGQAVTYVAGALRALGLEVRTEPCTVPHWVRGAETAVLVDYPGHAADVTQKIVLTALGGSVATPAAGLTAEVLVVETFEELEAVPPDRVRGRIVLFNARYNKDLAAQGMGFEAYGSAVKYRILGPSAAARKGAVASLVRSVGSADFRLPHTGAMKYDADAPKIPAAAVAAEDADLLATLSVQGAVRLNLVLTPSILPDAQSYNVVADLKGDAHPEEVVLVSGHLDSWDLGTGAIDDASGVAMAMQVAHLVRKLGLRPARTIRVVAWMNEENGLAGARAYAAAHKSEMRNHVAAIEFDGGAGRPGGFIVHGGPSAATAIEPFAAVLESLGADTVMPVPYSAGADISVLDELGVPTLALIQDSRTYFHYHHTAADTFDKIDPAALAADSAAAAVLTWALANTRMDLRK